LTNASVAYVAYILKHSGNLKAAFFDQNQITQLDEIARVIASHFTLREIQFVSFDYVICVNCRFLWRSITGVGNEYRALLHRGRELEPGEFFFLLQFCSLALTQLCCC
jgi:hypothetical protein